MQIECKIYDLYNFVKHEKKMEKLKNEQLLKVLKTWSKSPFHNFENNIELGWGQPRSQGNEDGVGWH